MPMINFPSVADAADYSPVPPDQYPIQIDNVQEASAPSGNEMWKLRLRILAGDYKGRCIFDNLLFSDAALPRVKILCNSLGLDVSGELDVTPELLRGRTCLVTVDIEEYEDDAGNMKKRNVVGFAGYDPMEGDEDEAAGDDNDIEF